MFLLTAQFDLTIVSCDPEIQSQLPHAYKLFFSNKRTIAELRQRVLTVLRDNLR